ncbi:MAG: hypothetical protein L3J50_12815 [Emcibacter sp.]|nr:hypothetical protein [Emcibacter sp.]
MGNTGQQGWAIDNPWRRGKGRVATKAFIGRMKYLVTNDSWCFQENPFVFRLCNTILVLFVEMIAPHINFIGQKALNKLLQELAAITGGFSPFIEVIGNGPQTHRAVFAVSGHIVPENHFDYFSLLWRDLQLFLILLATPFGNIGAIAKGRA